MFLSSTILYFGETPVGYRVLKTNGGLQLEPAPASQPGFDTPLIDVRRNGESWQLSDDLVPDLREQVLRLASLHPYIELPNELSAAT